MSVLLLLSGGGGSPPVVADWSLVITQSNGTAVHTFASTDSASAAPIVAFEGQDTQNDLGVAHLTFPAEHAANAYMVEDYLLHLYSRGQYVTSYIIGIPQVEVIAPQEEGSEVAVYQLKQVLAVAERGCVLPPDGFDTFPASADRIFDSSDPSRSNSEFVACANLTSVTDAQAGGATPYGVVPYGVGIETPATVRIIGPPGYGLNDHAPDGDHFAYKDVTFTGGVYRGNGTGDNAIEVRIDGKTLQPFTVGFGNAFQIPKFAISAGVHRVWARVQNGGDTPGANGPCTMALEFVKVDVGDNYLSIEGYTDSTWKWLTAPAQAPGFTPGEIMALNLSELAPYSVMTDVAVSFTDSHDSDGNAWTSIADVSTKSTNGLEQFWVKELTNAIIDIDAHYDFVLNKIVIDAWVKGTHHPASGITLTEGVDIGALSLPGAPFMMSDAAVTWNDGGETRYSLIEGFAPSGKPAKMRPLALGAARSFWQMIRDGDAQILDFNHKREKPTITQLSNELTDSSRVPPSYWKWSTLAVSVTSIWMTSATVDLVAVSFRMVEGEFEWTPEAGDLILPVEGRTAQGFRKLAPAALGGQSRVASQLNPLR